MNALHLLLSPALLLEVTGVLAAPATLIAQDRKPPLHEIRTLAPLPAGLMLPVTLEESLQAGRSGTGTQIEAVTTQRVLLPHGLYLKAGAHLTGSVTASSLSPGVLGLSFNSLHRGSQTVPLAVHIVAIANFTDVSDTALPASGSTDCANSNPANWTTRQVGGDEVARSGWSGEVINTSTQTVGFADYDGVYALPLAAGDTPHAVGHFSTTAHGLYGKKPDCSLVPSSAAGAIACTQSRPELRRGDNLLLQVTDAVPSTP